MNPCNEEDGEGWGIQSELEQECQLFKCLHVVGKQLLHLMDFVSQNIFACSYLI